MMDSCVSQWKIERCCVKFCFTISKVGRGSIDNNRELMLKTFKLWILHNLILDVIFFSLQGYASSGLSPFVFCLVSVGVAILVCS